MLSTYLLPESEDLEALEVVKVLPSLGALGLLGEVALGPLAVDLVLLPQLSHGASTGGTGQLGNDEVGEGGLGEREDVTGNDLVLLGGRTVNQNLSICDSCQYHGRELSVWLSLRSISQVLLFPPRPSLESRE